MGTCNVCGYNTNYSGGCLGEWECSNPNCGKQLNSLDKYKPNNTLEMSYLERCRKRLLNTDKIETNKETGSYFFDSVTVGKYMDVCRVRYKGVSVPMTVEEAKTLYNEAAVRMKYLELCRKEEILKEL